MTAPVTSFGCSPTCRCWCHAPVRSGLKSVVVSGTATASCSPRLSSLPAPPPSAEHAAAACSSQQTQITIVPPTAPQVPTTPTPIPQYTGRNISLDLKDYDIKDFFRLISEISGLNVVLDPNVTGTVTLRLTDVPWDQALDVVLKNYQLGGQLQGNVLRIATNATLQAEQTAQKALRDAQELASPLSTRTFTLNYTKADAVEPRFWDDVVAPRHDHSGCRAGMR